MESQEACPQSSRCSRPGFQLPGCAHTFLTPRLPFHMGLCVGRQGGCRVTNVSGVPGSSEDRPGVGGGCCSRKAPGLPTGLSVTAPY